MINNVNMKFSATVIRALEDDEILHEVSANSAQNNNNNNHNNDRRNNSHHKKKFVKFN